MLLKSRVLFQEAAEPSDAGGKNFYIFSYYTYLHIGWVIVCFTDRFVSKPNGRYLYLMQYLFIYFVLSNLSGIQDQWGQSADIYRRSQAFSMKGLK